MTTSRFLLGFPFLALLVAPSILAARTLARWLVPDLTGGLRAAALGLLAAAQILLVGECLGTVGQFQLVPLVAAMWIVGLAIHLSVVGLVAPVESVSDSSDGSGDEVPRLSRPWWMAGGLAVLSVAVPWAAWTTRAMARGPVPVDTLWYHLPVALRFEQTGRTTGIQFFDLDPVTAYFPASAELLSGLGLLAFDSDLISVVAVLVALFVALVIAWHIGAMRGNGPSAVLAAAAIFGLPVMTSTQPGSAKTDALCVTLLLVAVALLLHRADEPRTVGRDVVIGVALGLMAGTKYTFLPAAAGLAMVVVWTTERGLRLRRSAVVFVSAFVVGGYWYVRNLWHTGNPLPNFGLSIGPFTLPSVESSLETSFVAAFMFDRSAWRDYFVPGLANSFGPAWPVLLLLALAGLVIGLRRGQPTVIRGLAAVGWLCGISYLFMPQYLVLFGRPFFFGVNLRYALPAMAIGLLLLPLTVRNHRRLLLAVFGLTVLVGQANAVSWPGPFGLGREHFEPITARLVVTGSMLLVSWGLMSIAIYALARRFPPSAGRAGVVTMAMLPLVAALSTIPVHATFVRNRFQSTPPMAETFRWAQDITDTRIGLAGPLLQMQYPFAGADRSNVVRAMGIESTEGGFRFAETCEEFVDLIERGHYELIIVHRDSEYGWLDTQPDAAEVHREVVEELGTFVVTVHRVDPSITGRTC